MKIESLGEQKIIEMFSRYFEKHSCDNVIASIGEDCAVIKLDREKCLLVSIDTIIQRTHIPREMRPEQIGKYAVNVVLSDIAAMGGSPLGIVFSMALPPDVNENFVDKLAKGLKSASDAHETCIIGGDTQESPQITITGTALGVVNKRNLLLRSGAKEGDLICVTGEIGTAAAGFYCLTGGLKCPDHFITSALEPQARIKEGKIISRNANSCIDISDGLALSIHEISGQSKVGSMIYEDRIPVDRELSVVERLSGISQREMVLYKGGDFELLFTVHPEKCDNVSDELKKIGSTLSVIGKITKSDNKFVDLEGNYQDIEKRGWQAFSKDTFLLP
jgi:thiamine-monophosphate kinase